MDIETALKDFWNFVGRAKLVGYNVSFDMSFLRNASIEHKIKMQANKCIDILQLARRKVKGTKNYKMSYLKLTSYPCLIIILYVLFLWLLYPLFFN